MLIPEESVKKLSLTKPQIFSAIQNPHKEVDISGRGRGKSSDIAMRIQKITTAMPRSTTVISGESFAQLLTVTLAPVCDFLGQLGYHRHSHYVIGKPPASWPTPYQSPMDFTRFITFKNGTGFPLASQDRPGMNRGRNIDHWIGDEMLTQDRKKGETEIMASMRGNLKRFGNCSLHHGFYFKSSMPTGIDSQWLLEYSKYYEEAGYDLWTAWNELVGIQKQFIDNCLKPDMANYKAIQHELIVAMKNARSKVKFFKSHDNLLFTCYNAFENIENIGVGYLVRMRKQMSDISYRIEILNERILSVERGFYKIEKHHLYTKYDYNEIDNLDYDFDLIKDLKSRKDGDVIRTKALDMGIDYGAVINAMCIGQHFNDGEYRFLKSFYVKDPFKLKDLINDFANYYADHKYKVVNLYYDQTAVGRDNVRLKHVENVEVFLKEKGWQVIRKYLGTAPGHMLKFELWNRLLDKDSRVKVFFNKDNFKDALLSMSMAEIKEGRDEFKKDKSSEKRSSLPREQATDLSDAADLIAWGRFSGGMLGKSTFVDSKVF